MTNTEFDAEKHIVTPEAGLRLDRALTDALPNLSRSRVKQLINEGLVTAEDGTITDPSYRVKQGDSFGITIPPPTDTVLQGEPIPLDILHEDDALLVIDKPAGMTVHPGAGQPDGTLVNALIAHCGDSLSGIGGVRRPGIVHRLDKDTSGLIVAAKSDKAHAALAAQFEARTIKRAYHAFVWGAPMPPEGDIEGNIGRSRRNRTKMAVVSEKQGKTALTHYRTIERYRPGRDIPRVPAVDWPHPPNSRASHPYRPSSFGGSGLQPNDWRAAQYSADASTAIKRLGRQALHAAKIGFEHPLQVRLSASQVRYPKTCNWSEIALFPT